MFKLVTSNVHYGLSTYPLISAGIPKEISSVEDLDIHSLSMAISHGCCALTYKKVRENLEIEQVPQFDDEGLGLHFPETIHVFMSGISITFERM